LERKQLWCDVLPVHETTAEFHPAENVRCDAPTVAHSDTPAKLMLGES